jgi:hypothetical protein
MEGVKENLPDLMNKYDEVVGDWTHSAKYTYPTVMYNWHDPMAYGYLKERVIKHFKEIF